MEDEHDDSVLTKAFRTALNQGPPQPSWSDVIARTSRPPLWRRKRVLALAAVLVAGLVTIPALALSGHVLPFGKAEPAPAPIVADFGSLDRGAPPGMAQHPVSTEARRVLDLPLSNGKTATLWVSPTTNGGYCVYIPRFSGPGCDKNRTLPFSWGVGAPRGIDGPIVFDGSVLSRDAATVELEYQDGSSTSASLTYVTAPIDAAFFMFELPRGHIAPGHRPTRLVVLSQDGKILAPNDAVERIFSMPPFG